MEDKKTKNTESKGMLAMLGIPVLLAACCGLPVLLTATGFTAAGAFLTGKEYWLLGGLFLLIGIGLLMKTLIRRKPSHSSNTECCAVPSKQDQPSGNSAKQNLR